MGGRKRWVDKKTKSTGIQKNKTKNGEKCQREDINGYTVSTVKRHSARRVAYLPIGKEHDSKVGNLKIKNRQPVIGQSSKPHYIDNQPV